MFHFQEISSRFWQGLALGSITLVGACGKNSFSGIVKEVKVETRSDQSTQDIYADMSTVIEIGQLAFPNLSIPIRDPKKPLEPSYGTVSLTRGLDQKNRLVVSANLTEISRQQISQDRTLPNGTLIPVYGDQDLIVLPLDKSGKLYFDLSQNRKLLGIALAIKEFQNIGQYAPGLNLFFDVPGSGAVKGLAGVFTGSGEYQNGIAMFLDVTEAVNQALPTSSSMRVAEAVLSTETVQTMSARREVPQDWAFVKDESLMKNSKGRRVLMDLQSFSKKKRTLKVQ